MTHKIARGTLVADVADAATVAVAYPPRTGEEIGICDEGDFYNAMGHKLILGQNSALNFPQDFDLTFTTTTITLTNKSGATWAANQDFILELQQQGKSVYTDHGSGNGNTQARMTKAPSFLISLGAPDALVTNGVMAQQNRTNAGSLLVNGPLAVGGSVTLDVPRNVIVDSGGADTAVITVTGLDEYGKPMKESITLSATNAVAGKKAFKKITGLECNAAIANTAFIGTGDVLGLPAFLPGSGHILKELENGTAASAGTVVAGLRAADGSTATSADVRGTYDPNSACDGDKVIQLVVALPDPGYRGAPQYAG